MTARIPSAALAGVICVGMTATLTGCADHQDPDAGTNGVGKLSAETIEAKSLAAAEAAEAVRVTGKVVSDGRTYRLDMRLKEQGAVGEVATEDTTFEVLRLGKDLYLKADAGFWLDRENDKGEGAQDSDEEGGDPRAAARKLGGKYVKVPEEDPTYDQFTGFTTMDVMLDGMLVLQGERETGDRGEVHGQRVIQVVADGGDGGVIEVSLIGRPYPLRMERAGGAGVLHMKDWDKEFTLRPPRKNQIVDYGEKVVGTG